MLEIFFRLLHGETLSAKSLAAEYEVSTRSISRDINDIQNFLCDHRELMQNAEITYSSRMRGYVLSNDEFLKIRSFLHL